MKHRTPSLLQFTPSLSFLLLGTLLAVLWLAGGSARGDVPGQAVVRAASGILLAIGILFGSRPSLEGARFPLLLFLAIALFPLIQLVPLPPALWQALPGRDLLENASRLALVEGTWRPMSIAPGATLNAAGSLLVPGTILVLALAIDNRERTTLVGFVLAMIAASTFIGLLQVSGGTFNNPLINDMLGEVSGTFANRNHFALFVAIGCLVLPVWCFQKGGRVGWRGPASLGLLILFALTILATGSRAGAIMGAFAIMVGLLLARKRIGDALARYPRWVKPVSMGFIIVTITVFSVISFLKDRAYSINRTLDLEIGSDMRSRAMETLTSIVGEHFLVGLGFGTFDNIFRAKEVDELLQISYLNHAHNDYIEIIAEGGIPALSLIVVAFCWWIILSIRVWRSGETSSAMLGRLGSAILALVFVASAVDYPVRTPMIMALATIAALWLSWANASVRQRSPLPSSGPYL